MQVKLERVRALVLDIDGVLTDGRVMLSHRGDEIKSYDSSDGLGIVLLARAGIRTYLISGKTSQANTRRAKDLNVELYQGVEDKAAAFKHLQTKTKLKPADFCVVGDDLVDIPMMKRCGLAISVPHGSSDTKQVADYITTRPGGRGAVREVVEMILKSQHKWSLQIAPYLK